MLALSNSYVLQSHTELTSYSTVKESHIQALVPRVSSYPCLPEHVQFTHNINPATCYSDPAPYPQHTATVCMNFSGSRQNSAGRSRLDFENDTHFKSFTCTKYGSVSHSRNLPKSNYALKSLSNAEHHNKLKSVGNIVSRNYLTECPVERKATFHSMTRRKTTARGPLHDKLSDSSLNQKEYPCDILDNNEVNTQIIAHQTTQEVHAEDTSCPDKHQQCSNVQHLSSACRKLNHSIASILNMSSGLADDRNIQEKYASINVNDDHRKFNQTSGSLINLDTVSSKHNECFTENLGLAATTVDVDKNCDLSTALEDSTKRRHKELQETVQEFVPQSTIACTSVNSGTKYNDGDIDVTTDNTGKHSRHRLPHMNVSFGNTNVQEAVVTQDTAVLHEDNQKINSVKRNKCLWSHATKKLDFTSEILQANTLPSAYSQLRFVSPTTSAAILPPFHTLSQLHRKGAYDKTSAFKPISKLAVSLPQFPEHLTHYGDWTCKSFVPQNFRTYNRQANPNAVYSPSVIYPKCITDFSSGNNTFDGSLVGQHNGSFHQRRGYANILNSSAAPSAMEKTPQDVDRWMAWLHQTEEHPTKSSQFDEGISSRVAPPPRYHCDFCNKTYSTFGGLSKHRQFHCSQHVKKEFSCKVCNRAYSSLGALKMHIRTHTLPCKCQECGKAFSRPWLLQGHLRTHTGEKPFKCSHCGRAFADRSNLRAHLQTHAEIKRYACCKCGKTFSRMSLLTKHTQGNCLANMKNR